MIRTRFLSVLAVAGLAALVALPTAHSQTPEQQKQIAELEKQLADLQKKLTELKASEAAPPKPIGVGDMASWRSIRGGVLANNGEWFACRVGPAEGDGEVILRQVKGEKEHKFPAGGASFGGVSFSFDSKWCAFTINPPYKPATAVPPTAPGTPGAATPTPQAKVVIVNLTSGEKVEYEGIRRAAFNGESATRIALQKSGSGAAPAAAASNLPPAIAALLGARGPAETPSAADLILRELATGTELVLGNVAEFGFDKKGRFLAMTIDAQGQLGNGVQVRNMATGVLAPLDTGKASYRSLSWNEDGDALVVLKGSDDKSYEGKLYSIIGFKNMAAATPEKFVFDPTKDTSFPKDMTISPNAAVTWTDDLSGVSFGIHDAKKKEEKPAAKDVAAKTTEVKSPNGNDGDRPNQERGQRRPPAAAAPATSPGDKPDLVIWHWKDSRLQPMQQVQAATDKNFSYTGFYRVNEKKFFRLADDTVRLVSIPAKGQFAIGRDVQPYQLMANLDGRLYQDIYTINLQTGERKKLLTKVRWYFGLSPDGAHVITYDDGQFITHELATGKSFKITEGVAASFVDTEDDHNITKPPTNIMGWSKDGAFVLLSDNWDVWQVPVHGGAAVNLTMDGKKDAIRYTARVRLDPEEKGVDLTAPQYFAMQGEWTKKAGLGRLEPGKPGLKKLMWDDAAYGFFTKARSADVFVYTRETGKDAPDFYSTDLSFTSPRRLTTVNPQQEKFLWSSGSRLVDYTSTNGDKLQAALFLPANYQSGKAYPTIVYIYEHLSDNLNRYTAPTPAGFNKSYYTSNGYAVLMPDINYKLNDPGKSAVACILPAVEAAIATGVVDRGRVGLQGHSWGGYQTAYMITQSNVFKAACAGAPLTNLISMYSSIYWNTGSANQPIFESSQGRFTSGYWDNLEAYMRNSPVFSAKNVQTPLLLLHNDKDGAVDFTQGIEYFNTLRRLQKQVVMLQYKGENHGLAKPANRKDYTLRMKEFFDHYLMDKPAPEWLKEGIPHLKMDDHLKERSKP